MRLGGNLKNYFRLWNIYEALKRYLKKEQKEIFFHKKSLDKETEYFNFVKFLFTDPSKVKV